MTSGFASRHALYVPVSTIGNNDKNDRCGAYIISSSPNITEKTFSYLIPYLMSRAVGIGRQKSKPARVCFSYL
jgi:hypothetical protein